MAQGKLGFSDWNTESVGAIDLVSGEVTSVYQEKGQALLITHGGSGFSNSLNDIKRLASGARVTEGLAINGDNTVNCDKEVEKWLENIGLKG